MSQSTQTTSKRRPPIGPRLSRLLSLVFALFALLAVNSVYLLSITVAGVEYQNYFYQWMFLLHLGLGLLIVLPVVVFGSIHIANARQHPNWRARRVGYGLFAAALLLLASGFVLTRIEGILVVNNELARAIAYWLHVGCPVAAIWLFILHRLAGKRIRWRIGLTWTAVAAIVAAVCVLLHRQDPRAWNVVGPASGEQYFFPSLSRTATGDFIPSRVLQNDHYCLECHGDIHQSWLHSAHRLSSFNNPPYLFSVRETRRVLHERDGNVQAARFCAGCHDPVPFFSGAFDEPKFDDPDYDLRSDATAQAGITCTVCHSISHINSPRGNADYTIDEPIHYPFAFSDNEFLKWLNRLMVKAKPEFHRATFLKPLHGTTEFCGTCHKVHLPPELNDYRFLRGQNHQDSFWLSGVSGQGIASFYYPPRAETNCNGCHMPLRPSDDFGARAFQTDPEGPHFGSNTVHDHQFPSANTGIVHLLREELPDPEEAQRRHREMLEGALRVDLFGLREGGTIDGPLTAPLRPEVPALQPGGTYLLEIVLRTLTVGHLFTQGTADSNEVWLDVTARSSEGEIGRSGAMREPDREVDRWSHFVNSFVIDREGYRINRRNAQDIFVSLYNHQIPPGAADVVHYRLEVPADVIGPIEITVDLRFRKFDTEYMRLVSGDEAYVNDLPIVTIASDRLSFPVTGPNVGSVRNPPSPIEPWQRWNDFGIGLLRHGDLGELRQAEEAFEKVAATGRADGPLNLARVFIKSGDVGEKAPAALAAAAACEPPSPPWSLLWFGAQVARMNGDSEDAIDKLRDIVRGGFAQGVTRGFDFSKDWRVLNELGATIYQAATRERGGVYRQTMMREAVDWFERTLQYDPENLVAHWGLKQAHADLGNHEQAAHHGERHAFYKPDDNARDRAVSAARRRYPAADHAAEGIIIYDLHRVDPDRP